MRIIKQAGIATLVLFASTAWAMEICIFDGYMNDYDPPQVVIAASSDNFCGGLGAGGTGTVTHDNNAVGWGVGPIYGKRLYLYVDGKRMDSVSLSRGELLNLSTHRLLPGPHVVQGMHFDLDGNAVWSPPVVVTFVEN